MVDLKRIRDCGMKVRNHLLKRGLATGLDGTCKEAADLLINILKSQGINASKHFGWCIYDNCDNLTGEPCAPHCYVLIHNGSQRLYLDVTATQFENNLDKQVPEIILLPSGSRPYWFREKKPSLREMERISGY